VINEVFNNIPVLSGIEVLTGETIVLFISFIVDGSLFVELFTVNKNAKGLSIVLVEVVAVTGSSVEGSVNIEETLMFSAVFNDGNDDACVIFDVDSDERAKVDKSLISVLGETNGATVVFNDVTVEFVFELVAVGNEPDVEFKVLLISTVATVLSIPELDGLAL
jgi:hypothetical protein